MISRRRFITGFVIALTPLAATASAQEYKAQQAGRIPRVGILAQNAPLWDDFRQGLRDLGYVEGRTIVIQYQWGEGSDDRLPRLAADLARLGPDVIVTWGTPSTLAAKNATKTIPIVMIAVRDPVGIGLIA
ncbi:MAG TPA: ABC transporter substrate binding protein, partial [Gemmatimonadales bacterium]|nr:ABC transporter substrate binding protein [Gemmatimonadales bacterium]